MRSWCSLAVAAFMLASFACGRGTVTPEVAAGIDACHQCNMVIDQVNQACGFVDQGEFIPFDSPGCLLASCDERRKGGLRVPGAIFFADYRDGTWHPAESTAPVAGCPVYRRRK